jgi:hypothetical protein
MPGYNSRQQLEQGQGISYTERARKAVRYEIPSFFANN